MLVEESAYTYICRGNIRRNGVEDAIGLDPALALRYLLYPKTSVRELVAFGRRYNSFTIVLCFNEVYSVRLDGYQIVLLARFVRNVHTNTVIGIANTTVRFRIVDCRDIGYGLGGIDELERG